jgi:hypothetical protein
VWVTGFQSVKLSQSMRSSRRLTAIEPTAGQGNESDKVNSVIGGWNFAETRSVLLWRVSEKQSGMRLSSRWAFSSTAFHWLSLHGSKGSYGTALE